MTTRLKHLVSLITTADTSGPRPYVALEHVEGGTGRLIEGVELPLRGEADAGSVAIESGDVLFGKLRPYLAKTWRVDRAAYASTELMALRAHTNVESRWLGYLMSSQPVIEWSVATSEGSKMPRTSWEKLGAYEPPSIPGLGEQRAVADFLDRETARIDALIAAKRRMIEVLMERLDSRSQFLLSRLGAPNSGYKESDAPGFGEIPQHWSVRSIRSMFSLGRGRVLSHQDIDAHPGPYPVYSSQSADDGSMGSIDTFDFDGEYLTWTTDGANAGTVFHRTGRFNCTNVCGTLKAKEPLSYDYVRFALTQATRWFVRHDINPKLMNDVMASIRVPMPPYEEQRHIASMLGREQRILETVQGQLVHQIDLLVEHRQALITAAVTGVLNVPVVAA